MVLFRLRIDIISGRISYATQPSVGTPRPSLFTRSRVTLSHCCGIGGILFEPFPSCRLVPTVPTRFVVSYRVRPEAVSLFEEVLSSVDQPKRTEIMRAR